MTYYVPDWDDTSHSLKVFDDARFVHTSKGGAHPHQHHHSPQKKSSIALVPNHNVSESLTQMAMQGEVGSHITGEVGRASVPALDIPNHEDEMLSWLQYPLEDSFDRNYCSEFFGELVNPHVHLVKDTFVHQTMRETENTHGLTIESMRGVQAGPQQLVNTANMHCARPGVNSDAAMAMGAGRAAGLVSQAGSEAFTGVRTHVHPSSLLKPLSSSVTAPSLDGKKTFETYDPIMSLLDGKKASVLSSTTPTPSLSSGFNFSLFSRPVATTLDSLRIVGAVSGPTNVERARQPFAKDSPPPCEPSIGDSNRCVVMSMQPSSQQSTGFNSQVKIAGDGSGSMLGGWSLPTNLPCRQDVLPCRPDVRMLNETAELNSHVTCFSGSAVTLSENALGTVETTVSPSQLSGSSIEEIAEEAFTSTPKKKPFAEYTEDVEDVTANAKKPPPGPRAMKRSRAAETHNESEKKRRNKINVRLKALQSLIPHSNKTDKASVLDEAIEYTKMLQAQVQFMSMKTGMFVPQMMTTSGMHYVPVHQMPLSHMGMGMGVGMGFGMGSDMGISMCATDINAATAGLNVGASVIGAGAGAGAAFNSSPTSNESPSRQAHAGARLQQTSSVPLIHDVSLCLPTSCISEPYKMMLAQQPLQPMLMNVQMNPGMYNALVQQMLPQENHISNVIR